MATKDKLDRWRNTTTAILTVKADCPFWVTLTPNERKRWDGTMLERFFRRQGDDRREFRYFIRGWSDQTYKPTTKANELADRYARLALNPRNSTAVRELACRRGWVLRHGHAYGVVCV